MKWAGAKRDVPISELTDEHLMNIIKMIYREQVQHIIDALLDEADRRSLKWKEEVGIS